MIKLIINIIKNKYTDEINELIQLKQVKQELIEDIKQHNELINKLCIMQDKRGIQ